MAANLQFKRELSSLGAITALVDAFYAKVVADDVLGPVFEDIDLPRHKPKIYAYWRRMLLGEHDAYRRNMIARHQALHARQPLQHRHFERWLTLFLDTVDERFRGTTADRARHLASTIAANLETLLKHSGQHREHHDRA